jgi:L-alanine-DL-glutamate epimerase-like enolase superfamily enzyme
VAACRQAVGPNYKLMVDVAYAWPNARHALKVIEKLAAYDLFFVETPIDIDDLEGHAFLHEHSPVKIAAGEWQNTHWEFLDLADRGKLDVLQPDVGRVGGFSEAIKVCRIAEERNLVIVPHCWKSAIGIAASAHLAAATTACAYIEFLPSELSESPLRSELVLNEIPLVNGQIEFPDRPGLGIDLNRDALARFSEEHSRNGAVATVRKPQISPSHLQPHLSKMTQKS